MSISMVNGRAEIEEVKLCGTFISSSLERIKH